MENPEEKSPFERTKQKISQRQLQLPIYIQEKRCYDLMIAYEISIPELRKSTAVAPDKETAIFHYLIREYPLDCEDKFNKVYTEYMGNLEKLASEAGRFGV